MVPGAGTQTGGEGTLPIFTRLFNCTARRPRPLSGTHDSYPPPLLVPSDGYQPILCCRRPLSSRSRRRTSRFIGLSVFGSRNQAKDHGPDHGLGTVQRTVLRTRPTLYHGHPCPSFWLGPELTLGLGCPSARRGERGWWHCSGVFPQRRQSVSQGLICEIISQNKRAN